MPWNAVVREGMPVHRHLHDKAGSVYGFRSELDAWSRSRQVAGTSAGRVDGQAARVDSPLETHVEGETQATAAGSRRRRTISGLTGAAAALLAALLFWQYALRRPASQDQLSGAHFVQLTDFGGREQAAALSPDGRFVAFLSDRDGSMDVWVTQIGSGRFRNLTRGSAAELVNPSVRTLGFSPDGTLVTFWARRSNGSGPSDISVWAAPTLGGPARPYMEGVAEFDWSSDGTRVVYHTPGPGDPTFVRRSGQARAQQIFSAPAGLHAHFPTWSPDEAFIYFVLGAVPDGMDLWRVRANGGVAPEQITNHRSGVSHPVFLGGHTLLYLARDSDSPGLRLHALDLGRGVSRRVALGVDRYTSLSASADGRRLVVTVSSPKRTLWRLPLTGAPADASAARRITLTTESGFAPRLGRDFVVYVSSKGESDSIWKLRDEVATELWSAPGTRIVGAPAISQDGDRVAFVAVANGQRSLHVANADGSHARTISPPVDVQGTPAWAPDGSITVAAGADGRPSHLFSVPVDGRSPIALVEEQSFDPLWSPDGGLLVYSGPDIGTSFDVKAVAVNARASAVRTLTLRRGSRHLAFLPGGRSLIVLRGDLAHKDLWAIDLETGAERQLTNLPPDFILRDFDVSRDGREVVLEQVQERSDIFLIDLPAR